MAGYAEYLIDLKKIDIEEAKSKLEELSSIFTKTIYANEDDGWLTFRFFEDSGLEEEVENTFEDIDIEECFGDDSEEEIDYWETGTIYYF